MGYKLLGFVVWKGGKLYITKNYKGAVAKAALAGLGSAVIAGLVFGGRRVAGNHDA